VPLARVERALLAELDFESLFASVLVLQATDFADFFVFWFLLLKACGGGVPQDMPQGCPRRLVYLRGSGGLTLQAFDRRHKGVRGHVDVPLRDHQ
jgi:hypothetical protein